MAKPLALTSGEPAGIGPDIAITAWLRRHELKLPPFYLLGDRASLADRAKLLGLEVELADIRPEEALDCICATRCRWSRPAMRQPRGPASRTTTSADAAIASIRQAVNDVACRKGERGRHQSDRQERALPRRLPPSRPYRISRRTRRKRRHTAAAGDDAVVARACRRARDHPCSRCARRSRSCRPT